jgi:hypothetical protein
VWSGDTVMEGSDGLLRFVGRDDEMIKTAGNRISPAEIEEAVLAGEEVREAVAVGVPDERLGQAIVVAVAGDPAGELSLRARLRRALPSFMQPQRYEWHDELPRNANGKLDRAAIRATLNPPLQGAMASHSNAGGGVAASSDMPGACRSSGAGSRSEPWRHRQEGTPPSSGLRPAPPPLAGEDFSA